MRARTDFHNTAVAFAFYSTFDLLKAKWLFKLMANPSFVKLALLGTNVAQTLRLPYEWAVRRTVFQHFCGGETLAGCLKRIDALARFKIKTILDYAVEALKDEESLDRARDHILGTIELAQRDSSIAFAVFKPTALISADLLEMVSSGATLDGAEEAAFERGRERCRAICQAGLAAKIPVLIDAEESWIQQAIDALVLDLSREYNRNGPIVYNTAQMYRQDRLTYLQDLVNIARKQGFHLGIKLVRGAYMEKENERAKRLGYPSPIYPAKSLTDRAYDEALDLCVFNRDIMALLAGTHNEQSCYHLMELIERFKIPRDDRGIFFSQLLGMSDHISYNLALAGYNVAKYVPYGPIGQVLPYLGRRMKENTSVRGQTTRELLLIEEELRRRKKTPVTANSL